MSTPKHEQTITLSILSSPTDANTGQTGASIFTEQFLSLEDYNGLFITPRINALNFRHRLSEPNYFSDWHVAGDATLIIIRSGTLRIGLRNGDYRDFSAGDMFIAKDRLQADEVFNPTLHGHTAAVIGEQQLTAVHIKLAED
ncbi:cupin domain-containing protein [Sessilibacter sp. MAH4]